MVQVLEARAKLIDEFSGPADKIAGKTKATEGAMAGLGRTVAGTAAGFVAAQVSMAGMSKLYDATIGSAARFESQLAEIRALTGATAKDTDFLAGAIKDMAQDIPKSPEELGAGAYFILSSGITDAAEAADVLEIAAKASTVGLGETGVVADALTTVLNSYNLETGEAGRVTDILMQAVKDGKAEADDFSGVLGRVVPLAAQMGINFEEVAANLATFTRLGVSAEEAATGLRGVMTQLLNPSEEARDMLASYGLTIQDVRDKIREDGLAATLQDLMRMFQGNEEAISTLFPDVRGLTNVLATAGVQADAYTEILGNMDTATGNLDRGFAEVSETTEFKLNLAMSRLNVALMELGEEVLPTVASGAEGAAEGVTALSDAIGILNDVVGTLSGGENIGQVFLDGIPGVAQFQGGVKLLKGDVEGAKKELLDFGLIGEGVGKGFSAVFGGGGPDTVPGAAEVTVSEIESMKRRAAEWQAEMEQEVEPGYVQSLQNIAEAAKDARDALSDMFKVTTIEEIQAEQALNALELEAAQLEGRTGTLSAEEKARLTQLRDELIPKQQNVIDQLRLQKEGVELAAQAQTNALPSMQDWADKTQLQTDKVNLMRIALGELPSTLSITVALGLAQTAELDIIRQWLAAGGAGSIVPMQHGGIVRGGRGGVIALLGEGPHDEAVVPLTGGRGEMPGMAAIDYDELEYRFRSAVRDLNLTVEMDDERVGRIMSRTLGREANMLRRGG